MNYSHFLCKWHSGGVGAHIKGKFQAGIFLLNSTNTFEAMVGGQEEMFENFAWLPTWEDCRTWLKEKGVSSERVTQAWQESLAAGLTDREALYGLMLRVIEGSASAG